MTRFPTNKRAFNLFRFQMEALPVLMGWAAGSIAAGLLWLRSKSAVMAGIGGQFVLWGAIDGLIAALGLRGAAGGMRRLAKKEMSEADHLQQAERFERFVWLNAGLDVLYIMGGGWLAQRSRNDDRRRGMGIGIVLQGGFLLVWDVILALLVRGKRRDA